MQRQAGSADVRGGQTPFWLVTLGTVKLFWRPALGDHQEITYALYEALDGRGSAVALLKVLACQTATLSGKPPRLLHEATRDLLIEAIWGEKAERIDADKALNNAKCELNRALRHYGSGDPVGCVGGRGHVSSGYALDPSLLSIDADLFEERVQAASHAEGEGNPQAALSLWQQALSLAGGPFLPQD